eukprot:jgi/Botrbrau1/20257/Bobra.31_1s0042.1
MNEEELITEIVTVGGLRGLCAVKVKAGLMRYENGKMFADPRKGVLKIVQTKKDYAVHVLWYARTDTNVDSVIEPAEIDVKFYPVFDRGQFTKIPVAHARIYKLVTSNEDHPTIHFWMQEPLEQNDEDAFKRIQWALEGTFLPIEEDKRSNSGKPPIFPEEEREDVDDYVEAGVADMDEDAVVWGEPGLSAGLSADEEEEKPVAHGSSGQGVIQASQLQEALRALLPPPQPVVQPSSRLPGGQGTSTAGGVQAADLARMLLNIAGGNLSGVPTMMRAPGPTLAEVLKPEVMVLLLREEGMLERLAEFLPEQHRNHEALQDLARSTQLRQQMNVLSSALMSAQIDLSHFGLRSRGFTIADLLEAIQECVDEEASARARSGQ